MFKYHLRRTLFFGFLGFIVSLFVVFVNPKVYEARVDMLLGGQAGQGTPFVTSDVDQILTAGQARDADTERAVVGSQSVFVRAVQKVQETRTDFRPTQDDLIRMLNMYEVHGDMAARPFLMPTTVINVRVRAYDPRIAEAIGNAVTDVYNDIRISAAKDANAKAVDYVSGQLDKTERDLAAAEGAYRGYKLKTGVPELTVDIQRESGNESYLRQGLDSAIAELKSAQGEVERIGMEMNRRPKTIDDSHLDSENPLISRLEADLSDAKRQRDVALGRYLDDSDEIRTYNEAIVGIQSRLSEARKQQFRVYQKSNRIDPIRQQLEQTLALASARLFGQQRKVAELTSALAHQELRLKDAPNIEVETMKLKRVVDLFDSKYRLLRTQLETLKNRQESGSKAAIVLQNARAFTDPVAPDMGKLLFIGIIGGISLGLVYSFGVESLRLRVHSSSQLAELTGLPVVASAPSLKSARESTMLKAFASQGGPPMETYRYMAFAMIARDVPPRTVLFTGVGVSRGRSSSALQFAVAMAEAGKKVVLVDADPARGWITRSFGQEKTSGFTDVLGQTMLPSVDAELLVPTRHPDLQLLPAGTKTGLGGLGEVSTAQIPALLEILKEKADVVVIDVASCDVVADAARFTLNVDEVCLVVSAAKTSYRSIPAAYEILVRSGAKSVSLILTDASAQDEPFAARSK